MFGFAKKLVKHAEGIIAPEVDTQLPTYGFRVMHIEPDSEAFHAGIEPLFDFIVAANGVRYDRPYTRTSESHSGVRGHILVEQEQSPAEDFENTVRNTEANLVLEIWSAKGRYTRIVTLPNPSKQTSGLGLSLQWCPLSVADHVWHILNVVPNSPADRAGLVSHADYIVAGENGILEEGGEYLLGRVISRADPKEGVLFFVYNRDFDLLRPVRVFPTEDGKLGCGVGYGLLHSLPKVSKSQSRATPGSMVFDDEQQLEATYLDSSVAAKVPQPGAPPVNASPSATAAALSSPSRKQHHPHGHLQGHHHVQSGSDGLDSYFEEQSEISKKVDGSTSTGKGSDIPPPPKVSSS